MTKFFLELRKLLIDLARLLAVFSLILVGFVLVVFFGMLPGSQVVQPHVVIVSDLVSNPAEYVSTSPLSTDMFELDGEIQEIATEEEKLLFDYTITIISTDRDGSSDDQLTTKQFQGLIGTFGTAGTHVAIFIPATLKIPLGETCLEGLWLQERQGQYYFLVKGACE